MKTWNFIQMIGSVIVIAAAAAIACGFASESDNAAIAAGFGGLALPAGFAIWMVGRLGDWFVS